jgi:Sensors of blue-light using FAD
MALNAGSRRMQARCESTRHACPAIDNICPARKIVACGTVKAIAAMVRPAQILHKSVFLSVNNPRTPMADTQAGVQQLCASAEARSVTGMVLAGCDRWLCFLEGHAAEVAALSAAIAQHERPRQWHVLMSNPQTKVRMFPQHRIGWRNDCTPLEMAAFLSDLRRSTSRSQIWHIPLDSIFELLEPSE